MTNWVCDYEPPPHFLAFCGKRPYESESAARAAIVALQGRRRKQSYSQHDRTPREVATYRCSRCGSWHTTSMAQS